MAEELEVDVTYAARRPWVPRRGLFKIWAGAALSGLMRSNVLSVRVVGAARSRSLNARYRRKDKPTNVLSFRGAGLSPDGLNYLGELVICAPVVAREAALQGKSPESHWAHMTIHGVLHLLGFDHERDAEAKKMAAREIQILDRLGFLNPYV
ncbi:MAG TPA: rRNA maturation RNase YbeY [Steroidobacteraceae bacterium]|jgi:probable rRNA maturation factor|nr:rRNA maturation RNase YbeY [Steroidobacteraceae bacterium]